MHISANNLDREPLGTAVIDEAARPTTTSLNGTDRAIALHWDHALDDEGRVQRCVVCGCREIFRRYDFPQRLGLTLVIVAAGTCVVLLAMGQVLWAMGVLLAAVVIDRVVYLFTGECLVCYRCRSEFRDVIIDASHEQWDLSIGEKYRPVRQAEESADLGGSGDARPQPEHHASPSRGASS